MNHKTALERAFELADEGISLPDIRRVVLREGYDLGQLHGTAIVLQLGKRILAAKRRGNELPAER
jgi:hypothetical protein